MSICELRILLLQITGVREKDLAKINGRMRAVDLTAITVFNQ